MSKKVRFAGYEMGLPASQWARLTIGAILIIGGILGFLPIFGFWMIPLGLLVLSVDLPVVRRWRRQLTVWWHGRGKDRTERRAAAANRKTDNATGEPTNSYSGYKG